VQKDNQNLYIVYIDYCKAFDSVPHSWFICILEIYKIDPLIINSLQQLMKKWTTALQVKAQTIRLRVTRSPFNEDYTKRTVLAIMVLPCTEPPFSPT